MQSSFHTHPIFFNCNDFFECFIYGQKFLQLHESHWKILCIFLCSVQRPLVSPFFVCKNWRLTTWVYPGSSMNPQHVFLHFFASDSLDNEVQTNRSKFIYEYHRHNSPLKYFIIDWIERFLLYCSFMLRTFSEDMARTQIPYYVRIW